MVILKKKIKFAYPGRVDCINDEGISSPYPLYAVPDTGMMPDAHLLNIFNEDYSRRTSNGAHCADVVETATTVNAASRRVDEPRLVDCQGCQTTTFAK